MICVPTATDENISDLLSQIGSSEEPRYVPCELHQGAPMNKCFPLVQEKIRTEGGKRVLGWQIWKGELLIEAEFHAVWENPDGKYIDITPKSLPFTEILFVPDHTAVYEGRQVSNIRINITSNSLVDEFISIHEATFRIENKGERALQYELCLTGKEAQAHTILTNAKLMLEMMALQGLTKNSPCPCGSNKKYKACHGKIFKKVTNDF